MTASPPNSPTDAGPQERAESHYTLGNARMAEGDAPGADAAYAAAIALNPAHAGALNNRGNALRTLGRIEEAIALYQATLALRPEYFGTLNNIGSALLALHRPQDAESWLRRAVAAKPDYAEACNNLGGTLLALDRPEEARSWFGRALAAEPDHAQSRLGAAFAALALGDYRTGWRDYEARWEDPRFTEDVPDYPTPVWPGGGRIAGRTMLVHAEQGLGDTLQFVRYIKLLRRRGVHVILQVQPPLVELLRPLADAIIPQADPFPSHDLRCPLMSLPHAFRTTPATIPADTPYLAADPARIAAWRARLGPSRTPRIGIAFSGSPDHPDDALRSLSAAALLAALPPGAECHVIQTEIRPEDAAILATRPDIRVHAADLTDFAETAALLTCLDHIVTVDTSLAHLAGAFGRPVAILLQHAADFRWLRHRPDSPWYPTARLYRQPTNGDWTTPLAALATELAAVFSPSRPRGRGRGEGGVAGPHA